MSLDAREVVDFETAREAILRRTAGFPESQSDPFQFTDLGNARWFAREHVGQLRFDPTMERWLVYRGGRWKIDNRTAGHAMNLAKRTATSMLKTAIAIEDPNLRDRAVKHALKTASRRGLEAMVQLAQSEPSLVIEDPSLLDADPYLFNVANGTIDLRSCELRDHNPRDLITHLSPVTYEADADCQLWKSVLQRITAHNEELISFLQMALGYSLTAKTGEQCFFMLHGSGANGKGTFIRTVQYVMGDYATSTALSSLGIQKDAGRPRSDIARLSRARFVSGNESGEGYRFDETLIKSLSGDDMMVARYLHKNEFEFRPQFKLWIATNHKPLIRGTDYAIWRRVKLVPFTVEIPESDRDQELEEKLRAEAPGILNWLIEGCQLWIEKGRLPDSADVQKATKDYRDESDEIGAFIAECCEKGSQFQVAANELFHSYVAWCNTSGLRADNQTKFGRRLTELGFSKEKIERTTFRKGLKLLVPAPVNTSSHQSDRNYSHESEPSVNAELPVQTGATGAEQLEEFVA